MSDLPDDPDELRDQVLALREEVAALRAGENRRRAARWKVGSRLARWFLLGVVGRSLQSRFMGAWRAWLAWRPPQAWPHEETGLLGAALLARFSRIGVLALMISILATLGPVYFLFQQNRLIQAQSQIMSREASLTAFAQTAKFRDMMGSRTPPPGKGEFWPAPIPSTIAQFVELGKKVPDIVLPALRPLAVDENHQVSATAFLVSHALNSALGKDVPGLLDHLSGRQFTLGLNYYNWDLSAAMLDGCKLDHTRLQFSNLTHASLRFVHLSDSDLRSSQLSGARMNGGDFTRANLSDANLIECDLRYGKLQFADLNRAKLAKAQFTRVDLEGASLKDVEARGASWVDAWLIGVRVEGADFSENNFSGATLMDLDGWEEIRHIQLANIFEVDRPPMCFPEWAMDGGAVFLDAQDWQLLNALGMDLSANQLVHMQRNFEAWLNDREGYVYTSIFP